MTKPLGLRLTDPLGEIVLIGDTTGTRGVAPEIGDRLLRLTAQTVTDPDEIWYEWTSEPLGGAVPCFEMSGPGVVRRYLKRHHLPEGFVDLTALTTVADDGWLLREVHGSETAFHAARRNWLTYRRGSISETVKADFTRSG